MIEKYREGESDLLKPLYSIALLSDLHFMAWKETNQPVEWIPVVEDALRDIASLRPDCMIINGDLTNGKERDYQLAQTVLTKLCPFPIYYSMGNHEYYGYYEDAAFDYDVAQQRFLHYTEMPSIYYELHDGAVPILLMSTERYSPDLKDAGWLSDEQLTWLGGRLQHYKKQSVIVCFHQPINDTVAESTATCVQSERLRQLLETHGNVVFCSGHTHCRMDRPDQLVTNEGVTYIGGGCPHGEHPQSRWVDVYEDHFHVRLRDHRTKEWVVAYDTHLARLTV